MKIIDYQPVKSNITFEEAIDDLIAITDILEDIKDGLLTDNIDEDDFYQKYLCDSDGSSPYTFDDENEKYSFIKQAISTTFNVYEERKRDELAELDIDNLIDDMLYSYSGNFDYLSDYELREFIRENAYKLT